MSAPWVKKRRAPKARDGEVVVYYGYAEGDGPDVCVNYAPMQGGSANARFMLWKLTDIGGRSTLEFFEELDRRGFDLSTFRMSIRKKQPPPATGEEGTP